MAGFIACVALVFSILCFYEIHTLKKDKAKEDGGKSRETFAELLRGLHGRECEFVVDGALLYLDIAYSVRAGSYTHLDVYKRQILDITKAAKVPDYQNMPLSDTDYISYVLVVDKEFEKTEAFQDFIHSYNRAVSRLSNSGYLARVMGVKEEWLENKNIKFLTLEETGVD